MSQPYLAEIKLFGGTFNPRGFAMCNGQQMAIAQNSALFSLLGTIYGGNGQTTFGIPDFRGRAPLHQGTGPGLANYQLGQASGHESTTLTNLQMPQHVHTAVGTATNLPLTGATVATVLNGVNRPSARQSSPAGGVFTGALDNVNNNTVDAFAAPGAGSAITLAPEAATSTLTGGTVSGSIPVTIGVAGGSQPFSIMNPYLVVTFIIATEGIFPSRN